MGTAGARGRPGGGARPGERSLDEPGRADGYGAPQDHDGVAIDGVRDRVGNGEDGAQVGVPGGVGRRADADEDHVGRWQRLTRRPRKPETAGSFLRGKLAIEVRLVVRDVTCLERPKLGLVGLQADDILAESRETRRGHKTDIPESDNGKTHRDWPSRWTGGTERAKASTTVSPAAHRWAS